MYQHFLDDKDFCDQNICARKNEGKMAMSLVEACCSISTLVCLFTVFRDR